MSGKPAALLRGWKHKDQLEDLRQQLKLQEESDEAARAKAVKDSQAKTEAENIEVQQALRAALGREADVRVERDGRALELNVRLADAAGLEAFSESVEFESSTTLRWVKKGSPAWKVGMRPGDRIVAVAGRPVSTWAEVVRMGRKMGEKEREIRWMRDGSELTARVRPVADTSFSAGHLGVIMGWPKTEVRRYGALAAVGKGFSNTAQTVGEIMLTLRGVATRTVSGRQMGSIITIAQASYNAAKLGIGKLLYLTAAISAMLAFLNVLPIPVLDGGHLLFLAIEKLRGRRLGARVMSVAQTVGFVLLMLLVAYTVRNDILRLVSF